VQKLVEGFDGYFPVEGFAGSGVECERYGVEVAAAVRASRYPRSDVRL
jgi:hypothetical protein